MSLSSSNNQKSKAKMSSNQIDNSIKKTVKKSNKKIKAPVELVYAENDWSNLEERNLTAKDLNKKQFITINKTGHFSFIDRPEKMIEIILSN